MGFVFFRSPRYWLCVSLWGLYWLSIALVSPSIVPYIASYSVVRVFSFVWVMRCYMFWFNVVACTANAQWLSVLLCPIYRESPITLLKDLLIHVLVIKSTKFSHFIKCFTWQTAFLRSFDQSVGSWLGTYTISSDDQIISKWFNSMLWRIIGGTNHPSSRPVWQ